MSVPYPSGSTAASKLSAVKRLSKELKGVLIASDPDIFLCPSCLFNASDFVDQSRFGTINANRFEKSDCYIKVRQMKEWLRAGGDGEAEPKFVPKGRQYYDWR